MKFKLTETKYDLDQLLSSPVPTGAVRTGETPTVRTGGRYDRLSIAYPERIEVRFKLGTTKLLKEEAAKRGISVSKLIRQALKYYLENDRGDINV